MSACKVNPLCRVSPSELVLWARSIPLEAWPRAAGAMVGPEWNGAWQFTSPYESKVLAYFPLGCDIRLQYFSMILPGHRIATHTDSQPRGKLARIHVPLITNPEARLVYADESYHLELDWAYVVRDELPHSVSNPGDTPRLHWIFDVFDDLRATLDEEPIRC